MKTVPFKLIIAIFISTYLLGCKSKELDRDFAAQKITEGLNQTSFKPNEHIYSVNGESKIYLYNGVYAIEIGQTGIGFDSKAIPLLLTPLINDGLITINNQPDGWGSHYILTPTGKSSDAFSTRNETDLLNRSMQAGYLKLNDWKIDKVTITGIRTINENSSIVEFTYSKTPTNITTAGKSVEVSPSYSSSSASFSKYDDGWRLEKIEYIAPNNYPFDNEYKRQ